MNNIKDPAFPTPVPDGLGYTIGGLSKREYIAVEMKKALLTGIWANPDPDTGRDLDVDAQAVISADSLIAELKKSEKE